MSQTKIGVNQSSIKFKKYFNGLQMPQSPYAMPAISKKVTLTEDIYSPSYNPFT